MTQWWSDGNGRIVQEVDIEWSECGFDDHWYPRTVRVECDRDEEDDEWVAVIRLRGGPSEYPRNSWRMADGTILHKIRALGTGDSVREAVEDVVDNSVGIYTNVRIVSPILDETGVAA